jgi:hypothetical protein
MKLDRYRMFTEHGSLIDFHVAYYINTSSSTQINGLMSLRVTDKKNTFNSKMHLLGM